MIPLRFALQFDLHTQYIMKGINWGLVIDQNLSYPSIKVYASGLAINSICWDPNLTILIFWSVIRYLNLWRLLKEGIEPSFNRPPIKQELGNDIHITSKACSRRWEIVMPHHMQLPSGERLWCLGPSPPRVMGDQWGSPETHSQLESVDTMHAGVVAIQ